MRIAVAVSIIFAISLCLMTWYLFKRRSLNAKHRLISRLQLNLVREKAMKRHGWNLTKGLALEEQYRDFLTLIAENKDLVISPWSNDLDLFWHEHILDTKKYDRDCKTIFGYVIRHDPHIENDPIKHDEIKTRTIKLRESQVCTKEKSRDSSSLPSSDSGWLGGIFGCGASSNDNSGGANSHSGHSSSSDSHSGGHSHSCGGGHSCNSGHSCGGSSCGSSGCSSCGGS